MALKIITKPYAATWDHQAPLIDRAWLHADEVQLYDRLEGDASPAAASKKVAWSWVLKAANALAGVESSGRVTKNSRVLAADRAAVRKLATGEMASYSLEEIRRFLVKERPHMHKKHFDELVRPGLRLPPRDVDRFGEERWFLFAAHLAQHMMTTRAGTLEKHALDAFLRGEDRPLYLWPTFGPADLERLRRIYPFIPRPGEAHPDLKFDGAPIKTRVFSDFARDLEKLSAIPLADHNAEMIAALRWERERMVDVHLIEGTGVFPDLIPRMELMIQVDGLSGRDTRIVAKRGSADPLAVDVMRRVYGARVDVVPEEQVPNVLQAAISEAAVEVDRAWKGRADPDREKVRDAWTVIDPRIELESRGPTLVVHLEGIPDQWSSLAQRKELYDSTGMKVPMICVSHTSSDGKDLMKTLSTPPRMPIEAMFNSPAKVKDENLRFKETFRALFYELGEKMNTPVFNRRFIVAGFGDIVGASAVAACRSMGVDYAIWDIDPARRALARSLGLPVIDDFEKEWDRSPWIVACARGKWGDDPYVLSAEQLAKFSGDPVLISLGSGRSAFEMSFLEKKANAPVDRISFGHKRIAEYAFEGPKGRVCFHVPADGTVVNLAKGQPAIPVYAMTTPLLVWESMRQGLYHLDHDAPGIRPLRSIDIQPIEGTRAITLYPRAADAMSIEERDRAYAVYSTSWLPFGAYAVGVAEKRRA